MKKLDPKFLITCGVIIAIPILFMLIMFFARGCSSGSSYSNYEDLMIKHAKTYAKRHKMFPKKGKTVIIKLNDLVTDGMRSTEKAIKDTSCSGSVEIRNNSNDIISDKLYSYIPYLECDDYKTDYIKDHLLKNVVTSDSGLYKVDEEYIFKGNKANNYISFYGVTYRIIKMDSDGILKLIKESNEKMSYRWDSKYNNVFQKYSGINNYYDSVIIDRLKEDYTNDKQLNMDAKSKIIPYSVCTGKRSINDFNINITTECENKLDNQVISLPSITDFTRASYDANCKSIEDLSCTNYNYISDFINYSWTLDTVNEDSSKVYYLSAQGPELDTASKSMKYNWIIYIDGEELYNGGDGSLKNPYIIN